MHTRRPPLPLFLGLAVLTAMAHVLMLAAYAVAHVSLGRPVEWGPAALLVAVGGAGPVLAAWWMLTSSPRAGAALFAATMLGTGSVLFGLHYVWDTPSHVAYLADHWLDTTYATTSYMLLVLEMLGVGIGGVLAWRPERRALPEVEPAASEPAAPASPLPPLP